MRNALALLTIVSLLFVALKFGGFEGAVPKQHASRSVHSAPCALGTTCR